MKKDTRHLHINGKTEPVLEKSSSRLEILDRSLIDAGSYVYYIKSNDLSVRLTTRCTEVP